MKKYWLLILLLLLLPRAGTALAQGNPPAGPVYLVQPGDTFYSIALRFGLALDDLLTANPEIDPNQLAIGQEVIIPGLDGVQGVLTTHTIALGETYNNLIRRYQLPAEQIIRLNRLTSPTELYAGYGLIIPQPEAAAAAMAGLTLPPEQTPLELAILQGSTPWSLALNNGLPTPTYILPQETLYLPTSEAQETQPTALPALFRQVQLDPLPLYQGATADLWIQTSQPVQLAGHLGEYPLQFFALETPENTYVALQGIHALLEPGLYTLEIQATTEDGTRSQIIQRVRVADGGYYSETLLVPAETIDPDTNQEEFDWLYAQTTRTPTPEKYWQGVFSNPSYFPDCFTSRYGTRRLYKGAGTELTYNGFHSGLDFCGGSGLPITAPAAGRVVFSTQLDIRGTATLIDHGWGIYTGYWHQSETYVQAGDWVERGQTIGRVGGSGRVTGAHLHWEVWVNGVQVDPMTWLQRAFP